MTDPLKTFDTAGHPKPTAVSQKVYAIAGIQVTVFGLEELRSQTTEVACLWLLHPRLATQERMTGIAASAITDWNGKVQNTPSAKGLIAVSFDQRNHGTRLIDPLANEAWRQGNPRHAQDMFSIFRTCCWPASESTGGMFFLLNELTRGHRARHISPDGLPCIVYFPQW